jgi:hypothetical protein
MKVAALNVKLKMQNEKCKMTKKTENLKNFDLCTLQPSFCIVTGGER